MKKLVLATSILAAGFAFAEEGFLDRPAGIKICDRLTIRPYVSFSYTFDSNPDSNSYGAKNSSYWTANPGFDFDFVGENWKLTGLAYYLYHAFTSGQETQLNSNSWGEQLGYTWTNIEKGGPGWNLLITERYSRINQNDDMCHSSDGRGLWRDRQEFDANLAIQRRFTERWHATLNASYYWLDYVNDRQSYATLYGWNRWTAGLQLGYTASKWTDLFLAGGYQYYEQDCSENVNIGKNSQCWTVHMGLGSYMTERIEYSLSGGISSFKYGCNAATSTGFTYQGKLRWNIGETWMTTLLLNSYYHPSERDYGSSVRCDSVSWGIAKSMVRGKLNATLDVAYRRDTNQYSYVPGNDWDLNLLSARLGVNYTINRLLTLFGRCEFQQEMNQGGVSRAYDYDRWRATFGVKLTY